MGIQYVNERGSFSMFTIIQQVDIVTPHQVTVFVLPFQSIKLFIYIITE